MADISNRKKQNECAAETEDDPELNEWLTQIVMDEIKDMIENSDEGLGPDGANLSKETIDWVVSDVVKELAKGRLSGFKKRRTLIAARLCNK